MSCHEFQDEVILSFGMYGGEAAGAVDTLAVALRDVLEASDDLVAVFGEIIDLVPPLLIARGWLR